MKYEFALTLTGEGDSPEEAWDKAMEAFNREKTGYYPHTWTTDDDIVECYFCADKKFAKKDCLPADFWNNRKGGVICPDCLATRPMPNEPVEAHMYPGRFVLKKEGYGYKCHKRWATHDRAQVFNDTGGLMIAGAHWELVED